MQQPKEKIGGGVVSKVAFPTEEVRHFTFPSEAVYSQYIPSEELRNFIFLFKEVKKNP